MKSSWIVLGAAPALLAATAAAGDWETRRQARDDLTQFFTAALKPQ